MKIIGVKHEVKRENRLDKYIDKFDRVLGKSREKLGDIDLIVGPDAGLSFLKSGSDLIDFNQYGNIVNSFRELSAKYPYTLFFPGTTPHKISDTEMVNNCPVFLNGEKISDFYKETSRAEESIAQRNGLEYRRGKSQNNFVEVRGNVYSGSICSDHSLQELPKNVLIEAIMAYDFFAGFHPNITDNDERYVLVVNGLSKEAVPKESRDHLTRVECFKYLPSQESRIQIIEPKFQFKDGNVYDLPPINY